MSDTFLVNYEFPAAGAVWIVPKYRLTRSRNDDLVVSGAEFRRIHLAIASALCAQPGPCTPAEYEFLCDIAEGQAFTPAQAGAAAFAPLLFGDKVPPEPLRRRP